MSDLICNACQVGISSDAERALHYKGEWHRYNVKRRCAGLTSIPQALFESQLAALQSKKAAESAQKANQQCKACSKAFATQSAYQAHLQSKKHLKQVEKQDSKAAEKEAEAEEGGAAASSGDAAPAERKHDSEDDDAMEEDEEEEEGEAIPLATCLFCPKECSSVAACCQHMLKQHGFFIPFVENLTDLEGMLAYLGEKVGIGHVCLWCNGKGKARYPSTAAVQMHMKAKSHCKLRLEDEEDEEELLDYYDFDLDEEDEEEEAAPTAPAAAAGDAASAAAAAGSSSTALIAVSPEPARRAGGGGASSINDAGELVLADGSIVGSRAHKRLYKQHVRPSQVVGEIAQDYKRLQLTTDVRENPRIYRRKREAFHQRRRKREDLAKGLGGNMMFHFRAQVSY